GPALALARAVDLTPLFPRVAPSGKTWVSQGDEWLDAARGVVVRASGELAQVAAPVQAAVAQGPSPRPSTAAPLSLAAVGFPLWATARSAALRRSVVGLAVAASSVAIFHLVAAQRIPAASLVVPPVLLLLDAAALHRRASWR